MFGATEGIQIGEYGVAFNLTGILYPQMVRVGVHAANLLLDFVGRVTQIDAVAQALAHLGLSIGAWQAQAGRIVRQQNFRLNECVAIDVVEAAYNLTSLFNHRLLVLAYRYGGSLEGSDVGSLTDGVGEEAYGYARFEVTHLDFRLYRRVALQTAHGHEVHVVEGEFTQFRNL